MDVKQSHKLVVIYLHELAIWRLIQSRYLPSSIDYSSITSSTSADTNRTKSFRHEHLNKAIVKGFNVFSITIFTPLRAENRRLQSVCTTRNSSLAFIHTTWPCECASTSITCALCHQSVEMLPCMNIKQSAEPPMIRILLLAWELSHKSPKALITYKNFCSWFLLILAKNKVISGHAAKRWEKFGLSIFPDLCQKRSSTS